MHAVHLADLQPWEAWVDGHRARLARAHRAGCRSWVEACLRSDNLAGALAAAQEWVRPDPLEDEAQHRLIELLAETGDRTGALRQYETYQWLLQADGLMPLDGTVALYRSLHDTGRSEGSLTGSDVGKSKDSRNEIHHGAIPQETPVLVGARRNAPTRVAELADDETAEVSAAPSQRRRFPLLSHTREASAALARRERRLRVAVLAAAAIVLLTAAAIWLAPDRSREDEPMQVAVFPFSYSGSESYSYYGQAMMELLSRALDDAAALRTLSPRIIDASLGKETARPLLDIVPQLAGRLGATHHLSGSVVEAGGRVHVTARLAQVGPSHVDPVEVAEVGAADSVFSIVDRLTARILVEMEGPDARPLVRAAAATTDSLAALAAFLEGERLFRGMNGRYGRGPAYAAYQRAVEIDSTFALAWYRYSQLAYFSGEALSRVVDFAEAAMRHSTGVPWRERRLIEGHGAFAHGSAAEGERIYDELLRTYPRDPDALFGLALLLGDYGWMLGNDHSRKLPHAERILVYEPDNFMALWMVAWAEAANRNWTRMDSALRVTWGGELPGSFLATSAFSVGDRDARRQVMATFGNRPPNVIHNAARWVNWFAQNPADARQFARLLTRDEADPQLKALGYLRLAEFELALGRWRAGRAAFSELRTINAAWALGDEIYWSLAAHAQASTAELEGWRASLERWAPETIGPMTPRFRGGGLEVNITRHDGLYLPIKHYLLAMVNLRLGNPNEALRLAGRLEQLQPEPRTGTMLRDLAQSVRAHSLVSGGQPEAALRVLEQFPRQVPFTRRTGWVSTLPHDRLLRAELLKQLHRLDEAEGWYRATAYYPESVLAGPAHLGRAEIYERQGRREEAAEQYRILLDLWRDADPQFRPMIDTAQSRLQRLPKAVVPPPKR
jgi:tetratricopeptide (TPR) repeat protein